MKQISITQATVTEAMSQIDALDSINPKNRNCIRLLTEEMFSMANELLKAESLDYTLSCDDKKYTLRISTKTHVNQEARQEFLSMSSDGRNAANKGIKGMLGAVMESFLYGGDLSEDEALWRYGVCTYGDDYSNAWMLSHYMEYAPPEKAQTDWDGMEKSIIANFADDVIIGVRSGKLEMTVTKTFA